MRDNLLTGEGQGRGGRGAESYDRKKGWPSVYHSILSDYGPLPNCTVMCSCKIRYTAAPIVKHPAMSLFCRPFKSLSGSGNLFQALAISFRLLQSLLGFRNLLRPLAISFRLCQSLSGCSKFFHALVICFRF